MKSLSHLISLVTIVILTPNCKGIINNDSNAQNEGEEKIVGLAITENEPFVKTRFCEFYCNQDSAEMLIDQGYIVSGVSFNPNENIPYGEPLPFSPKKGKKNVLFIHFQPNFEKNENGDCPSSNLVIFLELDSLQNSKTKEISKNIQLALYTGGPFYKFETKGETNGEIQITNVRDDIVRVKLKLEFELLEENITGLEVDSELKIINQETRD